jgi:hypothetical protein
MDLNVYLYKRRLYLQMKEQGLKPRFNPSTCQLINMKEVFVDTGFPAGTGYRVIHNDGVFTSVAPLNNDERLALWRARRSRITRHKQDGVSMEFDTPQT